MITSILIANRGEIARRVARTCCRLGIRPVGVFTAVDANALHVQTIDDAVQIPSYLDGRAILEAARRVGADAIHPGYGFLAESADFARACAGAGFIFIGPSPEAIALMGDKRAARQLAVEVGVPVIPGVDGRDLTDDELIAAAPQIGFPVMVKAAVGGGGKGMRLVSDLADLPDALAAARREAEKAFGSGDLFLEKALVRPRHIEVQVFGDGQGNVIHLGERDCSIQRRHQKIIEESPAPGISAELRARLGKTAVTLAQAINYTNAGTVEFLLDETGAFYFLEMNTRLQVEHPVTEAVTGLDLVEWQIRIAEGEPLPLAQDEAPISGHAIEARLYAEDPANEFLPATGQVLVWREAQGVRTDVGIRADAGIRTDTGIRGGESVTVHFDPMVAKVIAHSHDRATAVRRLAYALDETVLLGVTSNLPFLRELARSQPFRAGAVHTGFLDEWEMAEKGEAHWALTAVVLTAVSLAQWWASPQTPGNAQGYWRNNPNRPLRFRYADWPDVWLSPLDGEIRVAIKEDNYTITQTRFEPPDLWLTLDGRRRRVALAQGADDWWAQAGGQVWRLRPLSLLPKPETEAAAGGLLRAPMPGVALEVLVQVGDVVTKGQPLIKLEAMKMEHTIRSSGDGVVTAVFFQPGDQVAAEADLLTIAPIKKSAG